MGQPGESPSAPDTTADRPPAFSTPSRMPADTLEAVSDTIAAPAAPTRIGRILVEGNARTDSARIIRSFEVPPGSRVSREQLRRGLRKLYALGLFVDVWIEEIVRGEELDLIIHVRERPRLGKVEFSGNQKRETSELEKKLLVKPGDIVTPALVQSQVDSLIRYYRQEGFARATVEAAADTNQASNDVTLRLAIREGEKVRITRIEFEGVRAFPEKRVRKALSTKRKGLFGGGELDDAKLAEDHSKLETFYKNQGYRDARVLGHEVRPGAKARDLTLLFRIDEGPRYVMGNVAWRGSQVVDEATLRKQWTPKPGERYDASRIQRAMFGAYNEYAERGYLIVSIDPQETVRDSAIDLTFVVSEGRPSHVRYVNIMSNRGTREKVIRREVDLHEGDRFKQSLLRRTHDDIMRLGLFETVDVDFTAADSSDVDVNLRVKEKQVGTASAGAGYTGETGITGFLELSHNNVLGNGQSLSLHLERGGRRSDYYLSFTEPWFRDTPTLLGFSVFNTNRERDLYDEKRVGGSTRIGRPLPWPDYSRGSISYRLEDVTITDPDPSVLPTLGQTIDEPVRTSSIETLFSRNSSDHAFYPTRGTRLDVNDEFAGGPFGGNVNFHKHRWDGRLYLPSLVKGVTTMARARIGMLGEYPDQNQPAPQYERFRLGGGSTVDPLRGYDDYQVVPKKFIRDVPVDTLDATAPYDSIRTTKLRYPGGQFMTVYTMEQQFPIVPPLRGVLFFDAGNTWDLWREIKPFDLKVGAGLGLRMEIPLLGNIGLDYGYGFHRDDGPKAKAHFLLGNFNF